MSKKLTPEYVSGEIERIDAIDDPHARWDAAYAAEPCVKTVRNAIHCIVGDFRGYLELVHDDMLDLLIEPCRSSKVKTKLLTSRIQRRDGASRGE